MTKKTTLACVLTGIASIGFLLMIFGVFTFPFAGLVYSILIAYSGYVFNDEDKKEKENKAAKQRQKVLKSVETNRPAFKQSYFEYAQEAEGFEWNEQGVLVRNEQIVTYGCYNDRMNQAVCKEAKQKKCEELARIKGWKATFLRDDLGSVSEKNGYPIDWYVLREELSKL